jgi:hypothetical protein
MSGIITLIGRAKRLIQMLGGNAFKSVPTGTSTASITFGTDGSVLDQDGGAIQAGSAPWITNAGLSGNYWIRATLASGVSPGGSAMTTWLQMNVARSWSLAQSVTGTKTCTLTIEMAADSAGTSIVGSNSYSITADRA